MSRHRSTRRTGAALVLVLALIVLLAGVQQLAVARTLAASRRARVEDARLRRDVAQDHWRSRVERWLAAQPAAAVPAAIALAPDTMLRRADLGAEWAQFTLELPDLPMRVVAWRPPFALPCVAVLSAAPVQGAGTVLPPVHAGCLGRQDAAGGQADSLRRWFVEALPPLPMPDTADLGSDPTARVHRAGRLLRVTGAAAVSGLLAAPVIEIGPAARVIGILIADSVRLLAGSQVLGDSAVAASAWRASVRYLPLRTGRLLAFP